MESSSGREKVCSSTLVVPGVASLLPLVLLCPSNSIFLENISFVPQIFMGHLLCAKPGPEHCTMSSQQDRHQPCPQNLFPNPKKPSGPTPSARQVPSIGTDEIAASRHNSCGGTEGNGLPVTGRGQWHRVSHQESLGDFGGKRVCVQLCLWGNSMRRITLGFEHVVMCTVSVVDRACAKTDRPTK